MILYQCASGRGRPDFNNGHKTDKTGIKHRPDNWKGTEPKELIIKGKLYEVLGDEKEVERIFPIVKEQIEY
ncbi:MAG: hypothetical protein JRC53_01280 [Deltaproteobacteria bacterium]|nr:hypothetical protein [Deltaproteobacteria bacterium]